MATGAVPASFTGLKSKDHRGLGFGKSSDFVRVSNLQRVKFGRSKVSVIRNSSNPSRDTVELEPASEGSQLLGIPCFSILVCSLKSETQDKKSLILLLDKSVRDGKYFQFLVDFRNSSLV